MSDFKEFGSQTVKNSDILRYSRYCKYPKSFDIRDISVLSDIQIFQVLLITYIADTSISSIFSCIFQIISDLISYSDIPKILHSLVIGIYVGLDCSNVVP